MEKNAKGNKIRREDIVAVSKEVGGWRPTVGFF